MPDPVPHPWDQLDNERTPAYNAFIVYRDMGYQRTVIRSYRQVLGKKTAVQASGTFLKWVKDFRWKERADAWDRSLQKASHHAELVAVAASRFDLTRERLKAVKTDCELGDLYKQRARTLLNWPLADKRVVSKIVVQGVEVETVTHYEGVDARTLAAAARIGQIGTEIVWQALHEGLIVEAGRNQDVTLTDADTQEAVAEATRLWETWEAEQRAKLDASRQLRLPAPDDEDHLRESVS